MSFYAIFLGGVFVFAFVSFFILSYRYGMNLKGGNIQFFWEDKWYKRIFFMFSMLGFLLCLYLILQNCFVYYWDYGGYWTSSYSTMKMFFQNPIETIKSVYQSVLESDYNNILPLLVSIPLKCFGYTFPRYVMINYVLFLVPVWGIIVSIIWKLLLIYHPEFRTRKIRYILFVTTVFLISIFTPFYYAMLLGYIDVACMVPSLLAVLLFMDYDCLSFDRRQVIRDFLIAGCLLVAFLFRRYFAYFGVGYGVALCFYSGYKLLEAYGSEGWGEKLCNAIFNLFIVGAFIVSVLLLFFRRLVERIFENNYSNQYDAYDATFMIKVRGVVTQLGLFAVVLVVVAIVFALISKKALKLTLFCSCTMLVTVLAFFQVQYIGVHHIYTIAGEACILMVLGIYQILDSIHRNIYKIIVGLSLSTILGVGTLNCFFPSIRPLTSPISGLYSQIYYPLQRNDIEQLRSLANYLNELTYGTDKYVYVCASGGILNASIMASLDKPYTDEALNNMYWTSDVDLRDGFNEDFLRADYVIVTNPVELHLADGTQEVVRFLCEEVQKSDSPIGRHFTKLEQSYLLDNDVTAYIYEKTSDFETSDYQYLADYYDGYYPEMEELFSDRIWEVAAEQ